MAFPRSFTIRRISDWKSDRAAIPHYGQTSGTVASTPPSRYRRLRSRHPRGPRLYGGPALHAPFRLSRGSGTTSAFPVESSPHGTHPSKGVDHDRQQRPVPQPLHCRCLDGIDQLARFVGREHRRLSFLNHVLRAANRSRRIHGVRQEVGGQYPNGRIPKGRDPFSPAFAQSKHWVSNEDGCSAAGNRR